MEQVWSHLELICLVKLGYKFGFKHVLDSGPYVLVRFLPDSFSIFFVFKWPSNIYLAFPKTLVPSTPMSCFHASKRTRKFPFARFEAMCQCLGWLAIWFLFGLNQAQQLAMDSKSGIRGCNLDYPTYWHLILLAYKLIGCQTISPWICNL